MKNQYFGDIKLICYKHVLKGKDVPEPLIRFNAEKEMFLCLNMIGVRPIHFLDISLSWGISFSYI